MGALFWLKRYLKAAVPLFVILAAVEWLKGGAGHNDGLNNGLKDYISAAVWAALAAALFTYAAWRRYRTQLACTVSADRDT